MVKLDEVVESHEHRHDQSNLHSYKCASCCKSAVGLLSCCHETDIRMHSLRLLRLIDTKPAASSQQVSCKLIVKTFHPQG